MPSARSPRRRSLPALGWVVVLLALLQAGWLAFDGAHALTTGDYVTPKSGAFAGKLGPWASVVSSAGIAPRSTLMKAIHLGLGSVWLATVAWYLLRRPGGWGAMLTCAVLGLWYLPFGTLLSVAQIVLLLLPSLRAAEVSRSAISQE